MKCKVHVSTDRNCWVFPPHICLKSTEFTLLSWAHTTGVLGRFIPDLPLLRIGEKILLRTSVGFQCSGHYMVM